MEVAVDEPNLGLDGRAPDIPKYIPEMRLRELVKGFLRLPYLSDPPAPFSRAPSMKYHSWGSPPSRFLRFSLIWSYCCWVPPGNSINIATATSHLLRLTSGRSHFHAFVICDSFPIVGLRFIPIVATIRFGTD